MSLYWMKPMTITIVRRHNSACKCISISPFVSSTTKGLMRESTNPGLQPYKYGGKELDRTSGLDAYDFGARMYFADRLQWGQMDPLCEKSYDMSPYNYCGNEPINTIDFDGMDWYRIENGTLIWNPNVHSQDDIGKKDADRGYKYVGETYYDKKTGTSYRKDGTVLYSNEKLAYQRMWYLADKHWRSKLYPSGKEKMALICGVKTSQCR